MQSIPDNSDIIFVGVTSSDRTNQALGGSTKTMLGDPNDVIVVDDRPFDPSRADSTINLWGGPFGYEWPWSDNARWGWNGSLIGDGAEYGVGTLVKGSVGVGAGLIESVVPLPLPVNNPYFRDSQRFALGRIAGNVIGIGIGLEVTAAGLTTAGGATVAEVGSGGALTIVAVPVGAVGVVEIAGGVYMIANGGGSLVNNIRSFPDSGGGGGGAPQMSAAEAAAQQASHQTAQRFHALADAEKTAINAAMNEFATGEAGARQLLDAVRRGDKAMPTTFSRESLQIYRDSIQAKYELLMVKGITPPEVMRLRLEIYRIWLGS